ncbi:flavin reductase (DIM6/NTAB) family NADH-FMN oxidoreductase RutF [Streptomyces sp. SAI-208]|uniref:flavin reductase family protein n=1 Tax=unclassified Streptomyces TaxID=2593676 RepID=UPI00247431ED|nr:MULTISPECIES: flavin reductase family protein [unclassified Streptomyces]MDH6515147.1 flavin reductase (DIM6/NTAB) family NADH-FMN oxidoreductase RutF [Streptomyces sp. SAI-090]MDH6566444.1 flavin reductase (DIM6/NTAB) family NADH-FMN oxidoreductase RutF [Streptomyces sp. SAI-117]MDH6588618.1 flavin reductase (DIM6/NTAB) family NADH-FMN oxidoreductase RutF [Streptomyces sp. SAI-133]MDH6605992.1 flavin reductase (DIM6/NTAB) family NADH-FMN oxidoreductase RutF [Streptomyces sp. SAI-208]MDH662
MSMHVARRPGGAGGRAASVDAALFRRTMGLLPTGVTVVTAGSGGTTEAVTASSVTSISLDPPLVLVSVGATGRLRGAIEEAGGFAVNVLGEDQAELSAVFAGRDRPRGDLAQERLGGRIGDGGHALLAGAVFSLECRTEHVYPGGDHVLFLGRVGAVHAADPVRRPLVHHQGGYTVLGPRPAQART